MLESFKGRAFVGDSFQIAVGSQFSHVQLFNPAASGRLLVLRRVVGVVGVASSVILRHYATALASLTGNGENKMLGSAASIAELRFTSNAALLGTRLVVARGSVDGDFKYKLAGPIIVPQNDGILVAVDLVNIYLGSSFEWIEMPA